LSKSPKVVARFEGEAIRHVYHLLGALRRLDETERADVLEVLEIEFAKDMY
jgi:hypothetical protein